MLGWTYLSVSVPCKLCERKRAKRHCPGVGGEICSTCCGAEREVSIDCPLECEFLQEARLHEHPALFGLEVPNEDIRLTEEFARDHDELILWLMVSMGRAMEEVKAVDFDVREALAGIIQTYRTLESGLIYEARSQNLYAARVQEELGKAIDAFRTGEAERTGMHTLRSSEILKSLVFVQRVELTHNNGRRRGRAFLHMLRSSLVEPHAAAAGQSGLVSGGSGLIL